MNTQIKRPPYRTLPLADGLKLHGGGNLRCEEKMDGEWRIIGLIGFDICGEQMRNGDFYAFDVVALGAQDWRNKPLRERLTQLDEIQRLTPGCFKRPAIGSGGEFLEAVLARGGEGVVIKDLDAPYGAEWIKCKRVETWDLIVVEKAGGKSSIRLASAQGEDFGWCPCRAAYDSLSVGDVVEIAAYGRHASGKLREPRFVRVRGDKMNL